MKSKPLAAFCASVSLYGCFSPVDFDAPKNKELIVNGYEASVENFTSVGAFVYHGGTKSICTVSFIKKDLALTAAHCIDPESYNTNGLGGSDPDYVLYGRDKVFEEYCEDQDLCSKHLFHVVAGIRHPKYDGSLENDNNYDLALLLLEREIPDLEPIDFLPKNQFETALEVGDVVTIAGYGGHYNDLFEEMSYGKLYAAEVPITRYHNHAEIVVGEKDPTKGNACHGDSGGPIYVYSHGKVQLSGVASRIAEQVDGLWRCGYGIIYGLPTLEQEWIESEHERLREKYPLVVPAEENTLYPSGGANCQFSNQQSGKSLLGLLLGLYAIRRRKK